MQQDGTKKPLNVGKKESIPMENTHDLLVGTLSIGIPSILIKRSLQKNYERNPFCGQNSI